MHDNSRLLFERYALEHFRPGLRVLEIGPDGHPSTNLRAVTGALRPSGTNPPITWDTVDIFDDPRLTHRMTSEYTLPVPDNHYDVILASNVLEHVRKPWVWLKELARATKPAGLVITVNPVSWPFHEAPYDCWRAYPEGMHALYDDAGIIVLLSKFESLEAPGFRRHIPGRSWAWLHWRTRAIYHVLGRLGIPVERAYDTITIGQKSA